MVKKEIRYNHEIVEAKWQGMWKKNKLYKSSNKKGKKHYQLVELAYSSGDLHIGHWFGWTAPDVLARYKRMQGYNVLFPVGGFDSFGLPAENAAIKHNVHPKDWTNKNIIQMRKQFATMGPSFDWDAEVITSDPDYYRWTQWLFLKLYEAGLVYRDKVSSNWCPKCKTVLANEHVVNGCCWRHSNTEVVQKKVNQWLVRITDYADRLIWSDKPKVDWPKHMRKGQNEWIGRSEGVNIQFSIYKSKLSINVFTTRPDTLYGATFMIIAPEHPLALKITTAKHKQNVQKYIKNTHKKLERDRLENAKNKSGVFTGSYVVNPLSKEKIPVWIADFVLMEYGTGAIMGVPAHDDRDWDFAKQHKLQFKEVVSGGNIKKSAYGGEGKLVNSGKYSGLDCNKALKIITDDLVRLGFGKKDIQYHIRDWTISRRRYWGAPVPIVYCDKCGTVPVPEKDLPVKLPYKVDYRPTGRAPLATSESFVNTKCPKCRSKAKRETETLDTYVDSSWYFFRYVDPKNSKEIFDKNKVEDWMPVQVYFGGPEHILGHTLYARFITKFLHDQGYVGFEEFAQKRINHGIILGTDGFRMSKSRGNVVNPDLEVKKYGADAVRLYLCFMGPHEAGAPWKREGIEGASRFLQRVWELIHEYNDIVLVEENDAKEILRAQHKTIQKVTKEINCYRFNTAVSAIMEYLKILRTKIPNKKLQFSNKSQIASSKINKISGQKKYRIRCAEWDDALKTLVQLLAPFAPHMSEEMWCKVLKQKSSVHLSEWPKFNKNLVIDDTLIIPVQINGKLRSTIEVDSNNSKDKNYIIKLALKDEKIVKWINGIKVKKKIFIPGKLVNLVV